MKILVSTSAKPKLPELTLTLSGDPATLDRVCAMLYAVSHAAGVGHSGTFAVDIDGDGDDRISVTGLPKDREPAYKDMASAASEYGGDFEILGNDTAYVTVKGKRKRVWPKEE